MKLISVLLFSLSKQERKRKRLSFDNRSTTRSQGYLFVSSFCFLLCLLRSTAELQIIATEGCGEFPNGATSVVSRSANVRCNEMEWNPNCVLSFDCLVADRSFSYRLDLNFVVVCAINSKVQRSVSPLDGEEKGRCCCCCCCWREDLLLVAVSGFQFLCIYFMYCRWWEWLFLFWTGGCANRVQHAR